MSFGGDVSSQRKEQHPLRDLTALGRRAEGAPGGSVVKKTLANAGDTGDSGDAGSIPGSGRSLEKGMATHSSILAWRILGTEGPGELQSMEQQRVRHD